MRSAHNNELCYTDPLFQGLGTLNPERMHLLEVEVEAEMFYTENSNRDWDGQIQAKMIKKESKMRREG